MLRVRLQGAAGEIRQVLTPILRLVVEDEGEDLVVQDVNELARSHRKVDHAIFKRFPLGEEATDLFDNGGLADADQPVDERDRIAEFDKLNDCLCIDLAANNALVGRLLDLVGKDRLLVDEFHLPLLKRAERFALMGAFLGVVLLPDSQAVDVEKLLRNAVRDVV